MSSSPAGIRDAAGMTAIEVVVSLVILSTVLLGIAATTSTAAKNNGTRKVTMTRKKRAPMTRMISGSMSSNRGITYGISP